MFMFIVCFVLLCFALFCFGVFFLSCFRLVSFLVREDVSSSKQGRWN